MKQGEKRFPDEAPKLQYKRNSRQISLLEELPSLSMLRMPRRGSIRITADTVRGVEMYLASLCQKVQNKIKIQEQCKNLYHILVKPRVAI